MASHDYDLRRLIEGLVMSQAYSRGSQWPGESEPPAADLFAVARVRPLTPRQYVLSLMVATSADDLVPTDLSSGDWDKRLEGLENRANGLAQALETPRDGFQVSVNEALWFSNNERFANEFLRDSKDRLVGRLTELSDPQEQIELAVWSVLSRAPRSDELTLLGEYLQQRKDRPVDGLRQAVWALLASTEFRFNY